MKPIGLSARTVQLWKSPKSTQVDRRVADLRAKMVPPNTPSLTEREAAVLVHNSDQFKDLAPSQIVPTLADMGQYVASESTLYRLLHGAKQLTHRGLTRVPQRVSKPRALVVTACDQINCWDITCLPAPVRGMHFYLYLLTQSHRIPGEHRNYGINQSKFYAAPP